ncbi:MAG: hypothetical protein KDK70_20825 [Myxococcales bacterium]|nr:hypothetical protein [Myxococcales bacterium]
MTPAIIGGNPGDTDPGDTDEPGQVCPDSPPEFACSVPTACNGFCGGVQSEFDADGCLRARCTTDEDCPGDRVCVRLGDWGSGASSTTTCEMFDGTCECGGTLDGSVNVRVCMPPEEVPPVDVLRCEDFGSGVVFSWEAGTIGSGASTCTVTGLGDTIDLECTGAIAGPASLAVNLVHDPLLEVDEVVGVETLEIDDGTGPQRWVKITSPVAPFERLAAVDASELFPPGETVDWWGTGLFAMEPVEIGCPYIACNGPSEGYGQRPGGIRVESNSVIEDLEPGESAQLPSDGTGADDPTPSVHVQRVVDGACNESVEPPHWYSLSIVWGS